MTPGELQALALGQMPTFSGSAGQNPNQVVVLNQGQQAGCIPCGDNACPTVNPSTGVNFDLNAIQGTTPSCVQWDIVNGGESPVDRNLIIGGGLDANNTATYGFVNPKFAAGVSAFTATGFTTNGHANALDVQYNNTVLGTGALVCSIEVNINTVTGVPATDAANIAQSNATLSMVRFPVDPQNGTCSKVDYAPFCSACVSNNNDGFITKLYTITAPATIRQFIVIPVKANAAFTTRVCYAAIGYANTIMDSAANQM